jgi:hypothetical protein
VVKDIESRQTNVRDFFLIESNFLVRHQSIARRTNGRSGRAARQRQRASDSQYRYGFRPTPSLHLNELRDLVKNGCSDEDAKKFKKKVDDLVEATTNKLNEPRRKGR